jgi:hypothetical protein
LVRGDGVKLRTALLLAGLGYFAARKILQAQRPRQLALEPGPPVAEQPPAEPLPAEPAPPEPSSVPEPPPAEPPPDEPLTAEPAPPEPPPVPEPPPAPEQPPAWAPAPEAPPSEPPPAPEQPPAWAPPPAPPEAPAAPETPLPPWETYAEHSPAPPVETPAETHAEVPAETSSEAPTEILGVPEAEPLTVPLAETPVAAPVEPPAPPAPEQEQEPEPPAPDVEAAPAADEPEPGLGWPGETAIVTAVPAAEEEKEAETPSPPPYERPTLSAYAPPGWSVVTYPKEPGPPRAPVAAAASPDLASPLPAVERLRGLAEIRRFFRTNETPIVFVSATAFNMLGIDRWVRSFSFVSYYDSFDGRHPNVFVPTHAAPPAFDSTEEICNYLLSHKEVIDHLRARGLGKAVFLRFDEETERLARSAGLDVAFPPAGLRRRLDSKIEATRLAGDAGVPSVPNVIGQATSYGELRRLAFGAGLGSDLVVQPPYGDSGQTTFFIASEDDWHACESQLAGEQLKVMRRIEPREVAVEAVITRHGTLVGPLIAELTGFPELTPYGGGWCGNDIPPTTLTAEQRHLARRYTELLGERLRQEGYRGYFELGLLADSSSGEVYLGQLNPRVTGASSMTNVTAVADGDIPLFLFHLLEFMEVDYEIDVDELNKGWAQPRALDGWSQFILKETADVHEVITEAPASGIWRLDPSAHGGIRYVRPETDWHTVAGEEEAFYLRIAGPGQHRLPGADLGILVTRGRLQTEDHRLTERALRWIRGIKKSFWTAPVSQPEPRPRPQPFSLTML